MKGTPCFLGRSEAVAGLWCAGALSSVVPTAQLFRCVHFTCSSKRCYNRQVTEVTTSTTTESAGAENSAISPGESWRNVWTKPLWLGCFALLSLLSLAFIWLFPYVPTQDGPAHLDAAATLLRLSEGSFQSRFFEAQWQLATNQLYHGLLVSLGSLFPLLVAEKLLLSVYALAVPASALFAMRGLRGSSPLAIFLIFPTIYSYVFYLGFYNFCLGLVFFLLTLGIFFRLVDAETLRRSALLTALLALCLALCYAAHIVAAANALLALGVMTLVTLLRRRTHAPRHALLVALAALPTVGFVGTFFLTQPSSAEEGATNFLSVPDLIAAFFFHIPNLPYKVYSPLIVHSWLDALFSAPWHLLLVALLGLAIRRSVRERSAARPDLLAALAVFLFVILWTPNRLGEIGFLTDRFLPYGYALLTLWLSAVRFAPRVWRRAALAGTLCAAALFVYRLPLHAMLNANLREFVSAEEVIEDDSAVLPLILVKDDNAYPPAGFVLPNMRYSETLHAVGYLALGRSIVTLNDYQASKGYFPLRYKEAASPVEYLTEGEFAALERPPFAFDLRAYREETGQAVDYLLLWGDLDEVRARPDVQGILAQLGDYTLVHTSEPRNLMRVYARQPLASGAKHMVEPLEERMAGRLVGRSEER